MSFLAVMHVLRCARYTQLDDKAAHFMAHNVGLHTYIHSDAVLFIPSKIVPAVNSTESMPLHLMSSIRY